MTKSSNHYQWLDLIRFLAAFAVLLCHGRGYFLPEYGQLPLAQKNILVFVFYALTRLGNEAVIVFFVLSGFLVGGKNIQRMLDKSFFWQNYAIDRFARIFPPLLGCTIFYYISALIYNGNPSICDCILNLLSLQCWVVDPVVPPFWSLSFEVWFYIVTGCIGCFCCTEKYYLKMIALCIVSVFFVKLGNIYAFIWIWGAFVYFLKITPSLKIVITTSTLFSLGLILNQLTFTSRTFGELITLSRYQTQMFLGISFAIFVSAIVSTKPQSRFLNGINRAGGYLASFSYSMYLSHDVTFRLLQYAGIKRANSLSIASISIWCSCMAIAMLVSYLLFLLFEKNTSFYKQSLKKLFNLQ